MRDPLCPSGRVPLNLELPGQHARPGGRDQDRRRAFGRPSDVDLPRAAAAADNDRGRGQLVAHRERERRPGTSERVLARLDTYPSFVCLHLLGADDLWLSLGLVLQERRAYNTIGGTTLVRCFH